MNLMLAFLAICMVHAESRATADVKEIFEVFQAELGVIKNALKEIQRDNQLLKNDNEILKRENAILHQEIKNVKTESKRLHKMLEAKQGCIQQNVKTAMKEEINDMDRLAENEEAETDNELKNIPVDPLGSSGEERFQKRVLLPDVTSVPFPKIVAFTATLTHVANLGPKQTLEYDNVITNIGNGYDNRDGQFSAPVSGVYLIAATVMSNGNIEIHTEIVKNGQQLVAMYGNNDDTTGHTIVVALNQGDRVWVRHFDESDVRSVYAGSDRYYCSFSGVMISTL